MRCGFLYLVAVMDWATRKVLACRLSNTMDAEFCIAALEETLDRFGAPEIFNSDRGKRKTPVSCTSVLLSTTWSPLPINGFPGVHGERTRRRYRQRLDPRHAAGDR